ncbi:MAG: hypothetical protein ACJ0BV_11560 [Paracoccaceae bacterium]
MRCLGENRKPIVARFTLADINNAADLALRMNEAKLNVYITINPINPDAIIKASSSATDNDIIRAHYSFADADDQEGLAGLLALSKKQLPDITVITGTIPHERRHAYWQLAEPCLDMKLWQSKQVQIAEQCKTDGSVRNPSRIMRLPGTVSHPSTAKQFKGYVPELVTMKVRINQCH